MPVEETVAPERRSTRSFGEYAFLEDSRYASQPKNISGRTRQRCSVRALEPRCPPAFAMGQAAASPSSVHGPIVPERRLVGVIRRMLRLLRAHGPSARRTLCFCLGLGFL